MGALCDWWWGEYLGRGGGWRREGEAEPRGCEVGGRPPLGAPRLPSQVLGDSLPWGPLTVLPLSQPPLGAPISPPGSQPLWGAFSCLREAVLPPFISPPVFQGSYGGG